MEERQVTRSYRDPLSEVWLAAAFKIGLRVSRSHDAFAHSDGKGNIAIAHAEHLDSDDCLAQMIFHELCHSLVEGPESFAKADWGLDNQSEVDHEREHATLRVQRVLAGRYGLQMFLAPTTDFRQFYDALGKAPLQDPMDESTCAARVAIRRSQTNPWWPHLGRALETTATIANLAADWAAPSKRPSLYRHVGQTPPQHSSGLYAGSTAVATGIGSAPASDLEDVSQAICGACVWRESSGNCLQAGTQVAAHEAGCERFELPFDCEDCGACCRGAYHSVTINKGDVVAERHPQLLVHHENFSEVRRQGANCAALESSNGKHLCTIYDDRPTCCRDFENGGPNCLTARRRLGFSL